MSQMYKKIKRQNGERFAQCLRNHHNGILEIPDIDVILRHAGRDAKDAQKLLPYLMSLMATNDNVNNNSAPALQDPFALLDQAGYDAFHADTLEKQNSIARYFKKGELLCTFNDLARYENYYIIHAVKKNVDDIKRKNFRGKEKRQDSYGTSVISIQIRKKGHFISIKNLYNHKVTGCDNTFDSNPDNIICGLSQSLKAHFNVDFLPTKKALPEDFILIGNQVFKYNTACNNIYYGDQAWVEKGTVHQVDKSANDALFNYYLFENKSRTLKKLDPNLTDSFADDFNRYYGGKSGLHVQKGNLMLGDDILISAENSSIKRLNLPALTTMSDDCLHYVNALTHFKAPALKTMGARCLFSVNALTHFDAPALKTMGVRCLFSVHALTHFNAPTLTMMESDCLRHANALTRFEAPALTTMGSDCLVHANTLTHFEAPALTMMGHCCLFQVNALTHFNAPALKTMGRFCLEESPLSITIQFKAAILKSKTILNQARQRFFPSRHGSSAPTL